MFDDGRYVDGLKPPYKGVAATIIGVSDGVCEICISPLQLQLGGRSVASTATPTKIDCTPPHFCLFHEPHLQ